MPSLAPAGVVVQTQVRRISGAQGWDGRLLIRTGVAACFPPKTFVSKVQLGGTSEVMSRRPNVHGLGLLVRKVVRIPRGRGLPDAEMIR
jgi:hypothetical protein